MIVSYLRGHKIEYINNEWVYSDNKQSTIKTHKDRGCGRCGKKETEDGHDACLGLLPGGTMNACCGHGKYDPYIQFFDSYCIRGKGAEAIISYLKIVRTIDSQSFI